MFRIYTADLDLYCPDEKCGGTRSFATPQPALEIAGKQHGHSVHIRYTCRNCRTRVKLYSLLVWCVGEICTIQKLAEVPEFGPPTPAKVFKLIGPEREYYLKGRRSENQGLGIAAFAYYRRVVENQKNRILDEIIRVCKRIGIAGDTLADLETAKRETQFRTSVANIKHGVPQALLVNGHNPLSLLHTALSEGVHAQTDEECLELATSIRVVLTDLADRIDDAMKSQAELDSAVTRLLTQKQKDKK